MRCVRLPVNTNRAAGVLGAPSPRPPLPRPSGEAKTVPVGRARRGISSCCCGQHLHTCEPKLPSTTPQRVLVSVYTAARPCDVSLKGATGMRRAPIRQYSDAQEYHGVTQGIKTDASKHDSPLPAAVCACHSRRRRLHQQSQCHCEPCHQSWKVAVTPTTLYRVRQSRGMMCFRECPRSRAGFSACHRCWAGWHRTAASSYASQIPIRRHCEA